jgi:hypothetical protein
MPKRSVIIDYSKEPDKELDNFSQSVYNALNPNTNFTWPATTMPALLTGITTYRTKLETAQNGTTKDTLAKNIAKQALADLLRGVAMEVNRQANSDLTKLSSSGLRLVQERKPVGVLPKPTDFAVDRGINNGDLLCTVKSHPDADRYNFYTAETPAPADINAWRLTSSSTRKVNISGFTSGKQYTVKCAYQGTDPTLVFSDPVLIYAP